MREIAEAGEAVAATIPKTRIALAAHDIELCIEDPLVFAREYNHFCSVEFQWLAHSSPVAFGERYTKPVGRLPS